MTDESKEILSKEIAALHRKIDRQSSLIETQQEKIKFLAKRLEVANKVNIDMARHNGQLVKTNTGAFEAWAHGKWHGYLMLPDD